MIVFPNAKINIGLRIVARRPDGYHDIETIFYPVQLHDALEFVRSEKDELDLTGINTGSAGEDNLVMKALRKLREKHQFPFIKVHLHKAIPAGAGLGGGSADASCLLKSVNRFFSLGISEAELKNMALGLGSDCPFFIDDVPAYATGRGEALTHVPPFLAGYHIVLMNPGLHISTAEAYAACSPSKPTSDLTELIQSPPAEWRNRIVNDFEKFAFAKFPLTGQIKEALYNAGAIFSLMSGSGSTIFGIFIDKPLIPRELVRFIIYNGPA
ncbi:MAG TPA: 4-(cytidine 5'-diphospho)-2-C-methyl-D-erythritol kinase [Bacteroidales bacterium]|nr:4-(cytidine 5'-diphospho)-2-C-methyl-D-erythritol kinase [Bacteroidales bacterium]